MWGRRRVETDLMGFFPWGDDRSDDWNAALEEDWSNDLGVDTNAETGIHRDALSVDVSKGDLDANDVFSKVATVTPQR